MRPVLRVMLVDDHGFVRSAIRQALTAPDIEVVGEAPSAEEALRIVQEALNNVRRHADATVVRVRTERSGPISRISVTDNGRGFDPSAVPAQSYGLRGMRERADLVGATLDIWSRPQDGTRITVEVTTEEAPRA